MIQFFLLGSWRTIIWRGLGREFGFDFLAIQCSLILSLSQRWFPWEWHFTIFPEVGKPYFFHNSAWASPTESLMSCLLFILTRHVASIIIYTDQYGSIKIRFVILISMLMDKNLCKSISIFADSYLMHLILHRSLWNSIDLYRYA